MKNKKLSHSSHLTSGNVRDRKNKKKPTIHNDFRKFETKNYVKRY